MRDAVMAVIGDNARLSDFASEQDLVAEIPGGIADLLHERAKEQYLRRVWQTLFLIMLVAFLGAVGPAPSLTPGEQLAGVIAGLGFLGYLAYGFTLVWPERWAHQLLLEEIEYRRRDGKWRWER
jgi:hypothetical protein